MSENQLISHLGNAMSVPVVREILKAALISMGYEGLRERISDSYCSWEQVTPSERRLAGVEELGQETSVFVSRTEVLLLRISGGFSRGFAGLGAE